MRKIPKKPVNTDEYLDQLAPEQASVLRKLRTQIIAAAPKAVEHFGYGLPGFMYNGHPLIYFGVAKAHCALYGSVPAGFDARLKGFAVSKGTVRFTPERPLSAALVKAIVKAKVAESEARWPSVPAKNAATKLIAKAGKRP